MILVTGAAGFIGFHAASRLLGEGRVVHGLDNLNPYYDPALKRARLEVLARHRNFHFHPIDLADAEEAAGLFRRHRFEAVVHLAAQAGVRYSIENPRAYLDSNLAGMLHVLEGCRRADVGHLLFASSSSVYGLNATTPFSVHQGADHPASLYAATKKAGEAMAHSYSHVFGLPATGLRLFTVYGPWGRPDMALFRFTQSILEGTPIELYGEGRIKRAFTYIDDVVEAVVRLLARPPCANRSWSAASPDPAASSAPYRLYNVGGARPVEIQRFVQIIEDCVGREAVKRLVPAPRTEVAATCTEADDLEGAVGPLPSTPLEIGIGRFVSWYRRFYGPEPEPAAVAVGSEAWAVSGGAAAIAAKVP